MMTAAQPNIVTAFRASLAPATVAFFYPDDRTLSYGQFDHWIQTVEGKLVELGLKGARRVAVLMPRSPLGLALFLATSSANICCPLSPRLKRAEYDRFFETTGAEVLVLGTANADAVAAAQARCLTVLQVDEAADFTLALTTLARAELALGERPRAATGYALMLQTSGTTSKPKLVFLAHAQILATIGGIRDAFALRPDDICLNLMPFQHAHGLVSAGLSSLMSGSSAVCLPNFSAEAFDIAFETFRPTWFTGSPAMHLTLLEYYGARDKRPANSRLRFLRSSSAPLPSAVIGQLEVLFAAPLIETYGLTETATMVATNPLPPKRRKVGSVGVACSGAEILVVTSDGQPALPNSEGEILIRGPSVITHYGDAPAADDDNFANGWLKTGDIGHLDEDGYLYITGRTKELIKRGGLSVYPTEVDNVLISLPSIADAVTFSVPHDTLGEDVISAVTLADGASLDERQLRTELFARLSSYKVPSAIVALEAIPKSDTGKFVRRDISSWFQRQLELARVPPRTALERQLLELWYEVLGRGDLGVTDNVFLYGGDPLRADRVQDAVCKSGIAIKRGEFYKNPTVAEQARMVAALGVTELAGGADAVL